MGVLVLVAIFIITLGLEETPGHSQLHRARRVQSANRTVLAHHGKYRGYAKKGA